MDTAATAGQVLREARRRAGLTQVELARRAGVTQSVISAYESGKRQPALPTLAALVRAAGLDLAVTVRRPPDRIRGLAGPIGRIVRQRRRALVRAVEAHGGTNPRVFGSVARGDDHQGSDVDLLVEFPSAVGLLGLGRLQEDLESVLEGIRVDLVPEGDVKPEMRDRVEAEAVPL